MTGMQSPTQRANRRRLLVFLGVFLPVLAAGLVYVYGRPAEYRAVARVQINPGAVQVEAVAPTGGAQGVDAPRSLLTELQVLTSRPVIEETAARLRETMAARVDGLGAEPVTRLQASLSAVPANGTDVVEIASLGPDAELAAALVNGVITAYGERLARSWSSSSGEALARATEEVRRLEAQVQAKREQVEAFRLRHNIVSMEREENEALAKVRGLTASLNAANDKLAQAEGRLRSLTESAAAGRPLARSRTANGTLANLEQRASQIREELSELRRSYTDEYLALDHRVRAQRARLAELERQIEAQRAVDRETAQDERQVAVADAREEAAAARSAVERIQQQIGSNRAALQQFTARFNEYKGLRDELARLEALHRDALQRRARLEAGELARRPSVRLVEAAMVPQQAWRPQYTRDAGIALAAALALGLLVMWVVELFNRSEPQPTILVPQPAGPMGARVDFAPGPAIGARPRAPSLDYQADGPAIDAPPGQLAAPLSLPRELDGGEVRALLSAATPLGRAAALLLLGGLATDELAALRWEDVDLDAGELRVGGASHRVLPLCGPAVDALRALPGASNAGNAAGDGRAPVLSAHGDRPLSAEELASELLCAAHDAGLAQPGEVDAVALRHGYLAFLARQGIRMSELARIAGRLPPEQVAVYGALAPEGRRLGADEVRRVMDGVQGPAASG